MTYTTHSLAFSLECAAYMCSCADTHVENPWADYESPLFLVTFERRDSERAMSVVFFHYCISLSCTRYLSSIVIFFLSIYTHTRLVALQIIFSCKMRKLILLCVFNFLFACKQFHLSVKHIDKVIQNVGCKVFGCKTWQNVRSCNLIDPWTLLSFEFDHNVCSV